MLIFAPADPHNIRRVYSLKVVRAVLFCLIGMLLALSGRAVAGTNAAEAGADTAAKIPVERFAPHDLYNSCRSVPVKVTSYLDGEKSRSAGSTWLYQSYSSVLWRAVKGVLSQRGVLYHHKQADDAPLLSVKVFVKDWEFAIAASYTKPAIDVHSGEQEMVSVWGTDHLEIAAVLVRHYSLSLVGGSAGYFGPATFGPDLNRLIADEARTIAAAFADAYLYRNNAETCAEVPGNEEKEGQDDPGLPEEGCGTVGACG